MHKTFLLIWSHPHWSETTKSWHKTLRSSQHQFAFNAANFQISKFSIHLQRTSTHWISRMARMWVCSRLINLALCALDAYRIFIYKSSIYHSYMLDTTPSGVCVHEYMYIWGSPGLFALWQPLTQGLTKLRKISCMCMLCTAVCGCVRVSEIISHTHTGRKQQQQQGHLAWGIGVDFSMIFNILRKIFVARRIFGRRWDYVTCLGSNSDRQRRR